MKLSKEIKTAILVIVSFVLVLWGITFLRGNDLFNAGKKFYVKYENVEGLTTASKVTVNGLVVGRVSKIDLQDDGSLIVELSINKPVDITKNTKAVIYAPSMLGDKQIFLDIDRSTNNLADNGDFLANGSVNGLIDNLGAKADPIMAKLDEVMTNVNALLVNVNNTLDPATQKNLQDAIANLNHSMKNVNGTTLKVDQMVATNQPKLNNIVNNFNKSSDNLAQFSLQLDKIEVENLQKIINNLESTTISLNTMLNDLNNGKGTAGKLLKDEKMYNNLEKASKELGQLLQDLKLNPKRYINLSIFGKKNIPYTEPIQN